MRRMVEIDYRHKHRHLPGSLSALPIIQGIYEQMDLENDVFILSKGHSCAALYAVLEACGYSPDVSLVHPERDPKNGVTITAGSLGHGLPIAVGIAYAKKLYGDQGLVHVLMGDGECSEGSVWEAMHLAEVLKLEGNLYVHIDGNGYQGSDALITKASSRLDQIFPVIMHNFPKGYGIKMFEDNPIKSVHLVTDEDYASIMEEIA